MPAIGDFIYGGYFAGWIDTTKGNIIASDASQTGLRYMLIVAPKSLEAASLKYKTSNDAAPAAAKTRWDGLTATAAMNSAAYPAAQYCAGLAAPSDGGSDWYLPAMDELELIYRNFKPTTEANFASSQTNGTGDFPYSNAPYYAGYDPSSDPAGAQYAGASPTQTGVALFRSGGAEALGTQGTAVNFWSATDGNVTGAWRHIVSGSSAGFQGLNAKSALTHVRPVRRITNVAPNAPTLTAPADDQVIDRASTNRFSWVFSDPDAGDSQSKFDLRYRLIGAGTWTDVTGTTPNQFWDAVPGTFAAGDYEWQVRTYDAQGVVGPYCASGFFSAADAPASPTITAPINGATVASTEPLTWSTPVQDAYQARRVADNAGAADTGTVYWDTGEVADAVTRTRLVDFPTNNRWEHIEVRVKDGGLWSPWADARVQVSFTPPPTPTVTVTPVDLQGVGYPHALRVDITNPAPGGGEPAVSYNDVFLSSAVDPEYRAATLVAANGSWTFHVPTSGVDYTARVVAHADNGTTASSA